jgi:hypothetical protein
MNSKQVKQRKKKTNPAGGFKALISVGAVAISLVGWGLLGKQEVTNPSTSSSTNLLGDLIHEILGPLPTLVPHFLNGTVDNSTGGLRLRSVSAPNQVNSRPGAITRTQSSR